MSLHRHPGHYRGNVDDYGLWRGRGSRLRDRSRCRPRFAASSVSDAGSVLEWSEEDGKIVVRRVGRYDLGRDPQDAVSERPAALSERRSRWTRTSASTCGRNMRAADTNIRGPRRSLRDDPRSGRRRAEAFIVGGVMDLAHRAGRSRLGALQRRTRLRSTPSCHRSRGVAESRRLRGADPARWRSRPSRCFESDQPSGFADCLILETARKAGHLPLGTFDRELGKIDGARRL